MTNKSVKKLTCEFIYNHRLINANYSALEKAAEDMGYTIIYFNGVSNNTDVETIIQNLKLKDAILKSRGFTYTDEDYRLVFINEDLNEEEKRWVLSHELGHIACEHYSSRPVIGNDVKEEHDANEFSHYLLNQSFGCKFIYIIRKYKKMLSWLFAILVILIASIAVIFAYAKEESYYGNYYITPDGKKYHESECVHIKYHTKTKRLTEEQYKIGEYSPCGTCLPE